MKKYFLSSMLVMGLMVPAFGADGTITGGAGTCTFDVLGVFDNNATANTIATWALDSYECPAGQYLTIDGENIACELCPTGSYCPGGTYTVESENKGANACPADYTSDASATAESECYIGCELACSTNVECPPHSNNCTHSEFKTTGKQFAGSACNAYPSVCPVADFGCDAGYHKEIIENIGEIESAVFGLVLSGNGVLYDCSLNGNSLIVNAGGSDMGENMNSCDVTPAGTSVLLAFNENPMAITIELALNDYGKDTPGVITQKYSPSLMNDPDLFRSWEYLPNANFSRTTSGENMWATVSKIHLPGPDTELLYSVFIEYYGTGTLSDDMMNKLQTSLKPDTLYAVMDFINKVQSGYFTDNVSAIGVFGKILLSTMQSVSTNLPWAYYGSFSSSDDIVYSFAYYMDAVDDLDHNGSLYSTIQSSLLPVSYCANNTINIDWNPDNGGAHTQNMCTYDGAITVPADPVKPGYTFTGWKLLESTTTE